MTAKGTSSVSVLCNSSNPVPSFVKLYVRRNPLVHDLGDRSVSWAVPTTRWGSPPFAENGTTAIENAASLLSNWTTPTVVACTGSMIRMHDPHVPAGAFGRPNVGGSFRISSLIRCFFRCGIQLLVTSEPKKCHGTNQFDQLLFCCVLTPDTVVALDDIEVVVARVCDHFSRRVRERHRVLFELCPEIRNLEDTKTGVSSRSKKVRRMVNGRECSVGTIGCNKKGFVTPEGYTVPCSHQGQTSVKEEEVGSD